MLRKQQYDNAPSRKKLRATHQNTKRKQSQRIKSSSCESCATFFVHLLFAEIQFNCHYQINAFSTLTVEARGEGKHEKNGKKCFQPIVQSLITEAWMHLLCTDMSQYCMYTVVLCFDTCTTGAECSCLSLNCKVTIWNSPIVHDIFLACVIPG